MLRITERNNGFWPRLEFSGAHNTHNQTTEEDAYNGFYDPRTASLRAIKTHLWTSIDFIQHRYILHYHSHAHECVLEITTLLLQRF